jgi:hypothetical protein
MGKSKSRLHVMADAAGIPYSTVYARIQKGLSEEEALYTPLNGCVWTKEVKAIIYAKFLGISNQDLADLVNLELGTRFTPEQIKTYKKNHKLSSGLTGHFEKGHVSQTKGKKLEDFMRPETIVAFKSHYFTKGHIPSNCSPVGSEVIRDGYLWVKIADPNKWKQKHIIVYEKFNGKVPKGKIVTFLDGDAMNFDKDNLVLISMQENGLLNQMGLRFKDRDMATTGIAIARLTATISQKEKGAAEKWEQETL